MTTGLHRRGGMIAIAHGNIRPSDGGSRTLIDRLTDLVGSDDHLDTMRRSAQLAVDARRAADPGQLIIALEALAGQGALAGALAVEVLGAIDQARAGQTLAALLSAPHQLIRRHAAWRLGARQPVVSAVPRLLDGLVVGGIDTMHAHRTLRKWADIDPAILRLAIGRLAVTGDAAKRARLIDLLGAIGGCGATKLLVEVARDPDEGSSARIAAIGALTDRPGAGDPILRRVAELDNEVGAHATLALHGLAPTVSSGRCAARRGLRIAQLTMAGGLDGGLSMGGRGDTGGVASLLVSLGQALADRPEVDRVLTIGRGTAVEALAASSQEGDASFSFAMVVIGDQERPAQTADGLWEHLPGIERGIRHAIRRSGGIDLLHLRMADAGTLAGAHVAEVSGIRTCFSLAADPHNVLHALQARREADQATFVKLATEDHLWFRARLVERLAVQADRIALFPRIHPAGLFAGDSAQPASSDRGSAVVAEGIDIGLIRRAEAAPSLALESSRVGDILAEIAAAIPPARRHLPLLLSVGRLHPVKGMDRVVAAWAVNPLLRQRCNLVIVGGELADPSPTERSVLAAIDRLVPAADRLRSGLQLLGGRPRADVARLLVSTASGREGCWAAGGVYVDGALKEEFGLALLEALAAGLVVVAPSTGGPPTYVDDGDTGVLVDPIADLAPAIVRAFTLVDRSGRAGRARRNVEVNYSVDTMAERLVGLYGPPAEHR
ncbi:MAG: glycosyltransferase [Ilumatobacteraceae bacterium]